MRRARITSGRTPLVLLGVLLFVATAAAAGSAVKPTPADYAKALAPLAAGDRDQALNELTAFERRSVDPERPTATLERLLATEVRGARRLAASDPASLVPVIDLHVRTHRLYRSRRELLLLRHSRIATVSLVEILVERGKRDPEVAAVAAWLLTDLGDSLLRARADQIAGDVLERAVALDPSNGRARLGLAAIYEKRARYPEAVAVLLDAQPPPSLAAETRLRLAINQNRLGETAAARGLLAALLHAPEPSWVTALAYQELARDLQRTEQWDAAAGLLREGHDALPDDQRLAIQLCHALERAGRFAAARRVAAGVASARAPSEWPRERYNRFPSLLLEPGERVATETLIQERTDDLRSALTVLPQAGRNP